MPPAGLIDTGAILAIVEVDDQWHSACLEALTAVQMPLLTTEAVFTELFHLIRHTRIRHTRVEAA
jgi:predicted nucleic acid-binding protein